MPSRLRHGGAGYAAAVSSGFQFAVGIEDTFVPHAFPGHRALDEYELTQHYRFWSEDLGLAAEAGAGAIRYGFPWYRLNPAPGRFRWDWADRVVDRLDELGLEAIVDLVHYGTPLWLDNGFLHTDFPARLAEYAAALADRYRGRLTTWTPMNEPQITAMHCGEQGIWPPRLTGHDGYVKLVRAIVRGVVAAQEALGEVSGGAARIVHVEATFRYAGATEAFAEEVELLRARQFLIQDLLGGQVDDGHPLAGYLRGHGFGDDDLTWCAANPAIPDVVGINYYPHLTTTDYRPGETLPVAARPRRDDWATGLEEVLRAFAGRYGRPLMVTETSVLGDVPRRLAWLDASLELVAGLREQGVEIVGYTWWPLFDLVGWEYRDALGPVGEHLVRMGLFDLEADEIGTLHRRTTPLVDRFRSWAASNRFTQNS
jgi:beta-glucosidase/6-phospho-beta-glucosidase/beta-galactosidase